MRSSSQHTFAQVPAVKIPRSSFRRNYTYKTTLDAGYLVPIVLDEVLPGDTFNLRLTSFARILSPLKYPIMDNLYMDFQFYFVPVRLVYDDYEKFFGSSAGKEGNWQYDDSHLMPGIDSGATGFEVGSIADYFGIPTGVPNLRVNALPFRAYNLVIGDWYIPSSYELPSPEVKTDSTDDDTSLYTLQKRFKRADYFDTALPQPQRGPGVELPLSGSAPIFSPAEATYQFTTDAAGEGRYKGVVNVRSSDFDAGFCQPLTPVDQAFDTKMFADLSKVSAATINSLRQAFKLQVALERDMRGGVMYRDQLMSHFGVRSPDARLQRSEYLGGGSTPIQIHTVANTSGSGENNQAQLAAYGVGGQNSVGFVKSFVEHGYIIGLCSVRADITYQQGLPKMFDRWARFDFYYPVFANIGEQAVKNKEIFAQGSEVKDSKGNVIDEQPFGYQERFGEYRFGVSKITGQLRSTFAQSLDSWHLAQKFNNLPTLNQEFLQENVPMSRVKAVTSGPDFLFDALVTLNCVRPMPLYGVPGFGGNF